MSSPVPTDSVWDSAQVYGLLSTIFRRPLEIGQLERLRAPEMLSALEVAGIDPGPDFAAAEITELCERLAIDFSHIFVAPEGKIMPYECIMIGGDSDLRGDITQRVERFMANVGYVVNPQSGEMADHISMELAFMSELAMRRCAGDDIAEAASEIQRAFLCQHLARWIGVFARRVKGRAEMAFYASMAEFAAAFIGAENTEMETA